MMTNYTVRYIRWRKKEGEWPRWGPYMVIRRHIDMMDFFTKNRYRQMLDRPVVKRRFEFGFFMVNCSHFVLTLEFIYDEYYWEVW